MTDDSGATMQYGQVAAAESEYRSVLARWAVSWAGLVLAAFAWFVSSLVPGASRSELLGLVPTLVLVVLFLSMIPAVVGLLVLLATAWLLRSRAVPDWLVVVGATVVAAVAAPILDLPVHTTVPPTAVGSLVGLAVLRAGTTRRRWAISLAAVVAVLVLGRFAPIL